MHMICLADAWDASARDARDATRGTAFHHPKKYDTLVYDTLVLAHSDTQTQNPNPKSKVENNPG